MMAHVFSYFSRAIKLRHSLFWLSSPVSGVVKVILTLATPYSQYLLLGYDVDPLKTEVFLPYQKKWCFSKTTPKLFAGVWSGYVGFPSTTESKNLLRSSPVASLRRPRGLKQVSRCEKERPLKTEGTWQSDMTCSLS